MRAVLFRCLSRDTTRGSIIMYNRWVVCLWCEVSMVTRHLIGFMGVCPVIVRINANNRGTRPAASGRAHLHRSNRRDVTLRSVHYRPFSDNDFSLHKDAFFARCVVVFTTWMTLLCHIAIFKPTELRLITNAFLYQ